MNKNMLVFVLQRNFKQQQSFKKNIDISHYHLIKCTNQEYTLH